MSFRNRLLKIEENLNYIKIKFFVEQTYVNTKIINSDFLFTYQIDYITFNEPINTTKYEYDPNGYKFTVGGERIGFIHFKSKPNNLSRLFENISIITEIDMNMLDTTYVTSMDEMCLGCVNLQKIDLFNCSAENLLTTINMFNSCSNLEQVNFGSYNNSKFKPNKLTDIRNMFNWCINLQSIDMTSFNLYTVQTFGYTWGNCHKLNEIKINSEINESAIISQIILYDSHSLNAKFYYNSQHDISKIIAVAPSNWTFIQQEY